jgi:hypothetical protein
MNEATTTVLPARSEIKLTPSQEASFWAKVNKDGPTMPHMESPCWVWTSDTIKNGYGRMRVGRKNFLAHRIAWTLANGPIPHDGSHHGICVCHRCDRRNCTNPAHFFLGTNADNIRDMFAKKRNGSSIKPESRPRGDNHHFRTKPECVRRGELHGRAKFSANLVLDIRGAYSAGNISQKQLAAQFGMSRSLISLIVHRKIWRHI